MFARALVAASLCAGARAATAVDLGTAGNYAILAKTGISTVPTSVVTGDIGVSPITGAAITGFSEVMDSSGSFATAGQVVGGGRIYAFDYKDPAPLNLKQAVLDMEAAYTDAAGRSTSVLDVGDGKIGGLTLHATACVDAANCVPTTTVFKFGTDVQILGADLTLAPTNGAGDVFIFQIAGNLAIASALKVTLTGGLLPQNVFWQVAGAIDAGTTSHLEGVFLVKTVAAFKAGSSVNGRVLAQTAVTLDSTTITA